MSTVGVIYTTNINELLVFRLFQVIGSCAGITVSGAIINDMMDKKIICSIVSGNFSFCRYVSGDCSDDWWGADAVFWPTRVFYLFNIIHHSYAEIMFHFIKINLAPEKAPSEHISVSNQYLKFFTE